MRIHSTLIASVGVGGGKMRIQINGNDLHEPVKIAGNSAHITTYYDVPPTPMWTSYTLTMQAQSETLSTVTPQTGSTLIAEEIPA